MRSLMLVAAFLKKMGKTVADGDTSALAKEMQAADTRAAVLKELHKYHVGKLAGSVTFVHSTS